MAEKSRRGVDSRGEKALGLFLDKYFYARLCANGDIDSYERRYNKYVQIQGIDMTINMSGREYQVDEKAQLYYINDPRDTFALEIDYQKPETNELLTGWFMSDEKKTDMFLLLWINNSRETNLARLVSNDFERVTGFFVTKEAIWELLKRHDITKSKLETRAKNMRCEKRERENLTDGIYLVLSDEQRYAESPVNLVVPKKYFEAIAMKKYLIDKTNIYQL